MLSTTEILGNVLPVFLILLAGGVLHRVRVLPTGSNAQLLGLVIHLLLPCLIIDKLTGNPVVQDVGHLLASSGVGFATVCFGIGFSWLAARVMGLERGGGRRTFAIASGLQNYGFMALPVLVAVYPGDGAVGTLFLHNLGVEIGVWTLGLMVMLGRVAGSWRAMVNGPIVGLTAGLILAFTGLDARIPEPVGEAMGLLGGCAVPLALLTVGMTVDELLGETRLSIPVMGAASVLRLAVIPVCLVAAARWLPVATELKQVLVVQAAMPSAVFPIVVARTYGGQPAVAIQVVVVTTLLSLLTMPFALAWGSRLAFP